MNKSPGPLAAAPLVEVSELRVSTEVAVVWTAAPPLPHRIEYRFAKNNFTGESSHQIGRMPYTPNVRPAPKNCWLAKLDVNRLGPSNEFVEVNKRSLLTAA